MGSEIDPARSTSKQRRLTSADDRWLEVRAERKPSFDRLSNSSPAVRLYSEGTGNQPAEDHTETQMRKLKIIEHMSLDGVIQHSADDGDFPYSDWTAPYRTPAGRDAVMAAHGERFDLLLGRRTYDTFAGSRRRTARALSSGVAPR
jgi:hypothetical protein